MNEQEIKSMAARLAVKERWKKTTPEERKAISQKMHEAKRKKKLSTDDKE